MKNNICRSLFVFINILLFSAQPLPKNIQNIFETAFQSKTPQDAIIYIEKNIQDIKNIDEKVLALEILADYEVRNDFFSSAVNRYLYAADISRENEKKHIMLKAFKTSLFTDNIETALNISKKLTVLINGQYKSEDLEFLVYSRLLKLYTTYQTINQSDLQTDKNSQNENESLIELKKYLTDSNFSKYHPLILLTLWWIQNDQKAKNTLKVKFPNSMETHIVESEITLSPKAFWYFMPRYSLQNDAEINPEQLTAYTNEQSTQPAKIKYFQVGFFKTENYANALAAELSKKGFNAFVKKQNRSQEIFFHVLVNSIDENTLLKLKSEGYEAVPFF